LPDPGTDVTQLFRNEDWFATTAEAVAELFDPAVESVRRGVAPARSTPASTGSVRCGSTGSGPWASYHVQVDEMFDVGDSVVVLVRDRARRHGTDVEVELISGALWTFGNGKIVRVQFYATARSFERRLASRASCAPGESQAGVRSR